MTPATPQPQHPLALLAEHLEAKQENRNTRGPSIIHPVALRNALKLHDTSSALLDLDPAALRAEQARINALEAENAALRAQAEAETSRERTYRLALLGLQRQDTGCWCAHGPEFHTPECAQAHVTLFAIAQAGGES